MDLWIRDGIIAIVAVADLAAAYAFAAHLKKNEREKEKWPT
jgi:hypothetical protein